MEAAPNNDGDLSGSSKLGFDAMGAAEYVIKNWILGYPVLGDQPNHAPKTKKKKKKKKRKTKHHVAFLHFFFVVCWFGFIAACLYVWNQHNRSNNSWSSNKCISM